MMNPYSSYGYGLPEADPMDGAPVPSPVMMAPTAAIRKARPINPYIQSAQTGAQEGAQATGGSMGGGLGGLFGGLLSQWIAKKYLSDKGGAE